VSAYTHKSKGSSSEYKSRSFLLSPSIGFVVKNNNVLGLSLSYGHGTDKSEYSKETDNQYSGGLFYRRYLPVVKNFYFFGQSDAYYRYSKNEYSSNGNYKYWNENNTARVSLYPGLAYAINNRFHIELALNDLLALNYTKYQHKLESTFGSAEDNNETLTIQTSRIGFSNVVVGFRIALGK
jgi:hypothetical protein